LNSEAELEGVGGEVENVHEIIDVRFVLPGDEKGAIGVLFDAADVILAGDGFEDLLK